ncbi:MAG: bifunctional (p)ppGpp synthetase/guanosine-3',5'-bis(diphosphate) 3'-pyrophosphohydrolase [Gammaproteobacteria bacterium]|nr:bifunctional (p)ppGpp synthetase/guanosine-3',5'-bis(diphosphate) 3'-pyrophosphohydrolase [Gammaproteobacteria bacterium]MDH4310264.1 bifunctional (p)ppGpp synthetase/guanosine-3',5'-bis(diphosphate) 3'-pyrophosphohydrolase [Gammaproteobacteria bacterium]MDH5273261.1 bifunctional (p)ppGpp synthetase/guanosine-3',5'-bis(diphosphate) 3'-pyrophosphohydrolase [Gammaproteobacteria bacterium]
MDVTSSLRSLLPYGRRSIGINQLIAKLETYLPPDQVELVQEAYDFAFHAHDGQRRRSGEPYITHPVAVADMLADLKLDAQTMMAAILHDVMEDTPNTKDEITARFGSDVAELVDGVSKLDQIQFRSRAEAQAESFRKMLLAMVRDIRVIMVKLADRTHNMRTLGAMPPAKRRTIARETLEIYAPIANRLGMHSIKRELEDLGFRALYPRRYKVIESAVKSVRGNHKQFVGRIAASLKEALDLAHIPAQIEGREKDVYSIYEKMRRKKVSLNEIVDVYGFRLVVDKPDTCYRTLGVVHSVFKPMPGRFKDYIAIPRVNGYQSLHTTLFGPNGAPIEVQIRTSEMHSIAESGIAAHWQYKEGGGTEGGMQGDRAREWLQQLVEIQQGGNPEEFLESVRVDLFPDKVYVFTPKGEIRRLPRNSTCVDFAYAVHTDVGNRCVAAKVDRRLVPLRTPLRNGQTVEIITAKGATPNPAWVNFVVTAKARAAIRQYLKNLKRGEAVDLGKRLLNQALEEFSLSLRKIPTAALDAVVAELGLRAHDDLFERIGLGERVAPFIARRLLPADSEGVVEAIAGPLAIAGTEGLVVSYARCCFPIPNDPILASLSTGRGVVIHREACGNLASFRKQPEKWIPVTWQAATDRLFHVEIRADVTNRMGVLASVASAIAGTQTNIDRVSVVERDTDTSTLIFELMVHDRKQLASVIRAVRGMPDVLKVARSLS